MDDRFLNMITKQFCHSEEELREQLQGIPGITRAIPTRVDGQALIASGGYFSVAAAVQVCNDLCRQRPEDLLWLQRLQQKGEALAEEKAVLLLPPPRTSAETALFAAWFGQDPANSEDLPDIRSALKSHTGKENPIAPLNCSILDAEVGRSILEYADPDLLPTWGLLSSSGCLPRKKPSETRQAGLDADFRLLHLLSIILGEDREDGMNMELVYFATWIPAFNRHVVARAAPMTDIFERPDVAIGSISAGDDILTSVKDLLIRDWLNLREYLDVDSRWTVSREGLVDQATAEQVATAAWPEEKKLGHPKQHWPYCASEEELRKYLKSITSREKHTFIDKLDYEELCATIISIY